jgi:hypothetical protein
MEAYSQELDTLLQQYLIGSKRAEDYFVGTFTAIWAAFAFSTMLISFYTTKLWT